MIHCSLDFKWNVMFVLFSCLFSSLVVCRFAVGYRNFFSYNNRSYITFHMKGNTLRENFGRRRDSCSLSLLSYMFLYAIYLNMHYMHFIYFKMGNGKEREEKTKAAHVPLTFSHCLFHCCIYKIGHSARLCDKCECVCNDTCTAYRDMCNMCALYVLFSGYSMLQWETKCRYAHCCFQLLSNHTRTAMTTKVSWLTYPEYCLFSK